MKTKTGYELEVDIGGTALAVLYAAFAWMIYAGGWDLSPAVMAATLALASANCAVNAIWFRMVKETD